MPRRASHGRQAIRKGARDYRIVAEFDIDGRDFAAERQAKGAAPKLPRPPVAYFSSWRAQREVGELPVTAGKPARGHDMKGQQELFALFGWAISQQLDGAFIVIDEPELHLDPSWHRLLMRSMQEVLPNSQFLVATHSPEVFESAYSFERLFLTPPAITQPTAETTDIGARRNSA